MPYKIQVFRFKFVKKIQKFVKKYTFSIQYPYNGKIRWFYTVHLNCIQITSDLTGSICEFPCQYNTSFMFAFIKKSYDFSSHFFLRKMRMEMYPFRFFPGIFKISEGAQTFSDCVYSSNCSKHLVIVHIFPIVPNI